MLSNLDDLMMKMCASKNSGIGVEVDGLIYFYEDFKDDDGISRAYRHFGTDSNITFYSMTWAHQRRIKELMDLYIALKENNETEKTKRLEKVISKYIVKWNDLEKAPELVNEEWNRGELELDQKTNNKTDVEAKDTRNNQKRRHSRSMCR